MRPWASRSANHTASFASLLRPGMLRTCCAFARTRGQVSSRTCQTGFQYAPVDSFERHERRLVRNVAIEPDRASQRVGRQEQRDAVGVPERLAPARRRSASEAAVYSVRRINAVSTFGLLGLYPDYAHSADLSKGAAESAAQRSSVPVDPRAGVLDFVW